MCDQTSRSKNNPSLFSPPHSSPFPPAAHQTADSSPTTEFAAARRLFLKDPTARKHQALFTWQCQVAGGLFSSDNAGVWSTPDALQFLVDPYQLTMAEFNSKSLQKSFDSYFLELVVSESEVNNVLQVLENDALTCNVRKAAASQFVTFLVSDRRVPSIVRGRFSPFLALIRALVNRDFYTDEGKKDGEWEFYLCCNKVKVC